MISVNTDIQNYKKDTRLGTFFMVEMTAHLNCSIFIKKDKLQELLSENKSQPWYGQLMTTTQTIAYFIQFDYWLRKYKVRFV